MQVNHTVEVSRTCLWLQLVQIPLADEVAMFRRGSEFLQGTPMHYVQTRCHLLSCLPDGTDAKVKTGRRI
jgi:hypothetical protein